MKSNLKKSAVLFVSALFLNFAHSQSRTVQSQTSQLRTALSQADAEEFQSKPQLANATKDYPVTAGDVYQLSYAVGTNAVTYTIPVDSSYTIRVANLATINGSGKTFMQLKQQVEDVVNRNYPMGGVQFFILNPSSFSVVVKGEVESTQIKQTWALNRLSSVLDDSLTDSASRRFVTVISKNGKTATYDLFKASRYGDLTQNPYLRPEDTIVISRHTRKITISGAVERPGTYEILDDENFIELYKTYGDGLSHRADKSRIELFRTYDAVGSSGRKLYLDSKIFDEGYELLDNDSVWIGSYDDLVQVVFLEGAVFVAQDDTQLVSSNKISVPFNEGENYAFFVRRNHSYFSASSDLQNAYIRRGTNMIPINLENILYDKNYSSEFSVEPYDVLMVPFSQSFVTVAGAVRVPGRYPYIPDRTWEYYIGLAGGFDKNQNTSGTIKIQDKNNRPCSKKDMITPESTITAQTTSFTYYFNKYAPVITTTLTAISTTLSVMAATGAFSK